MNIYNYELIIRPVNSFFFGGEKKFNSAEEGETNYLVSSMVVPQQTTILGMLRYALLMRQIKLEGSAAWKDVDLIGENSFDGKSTSFGIIQKLSPIYFKKNNILFEEAGLNIQIYKDENDNDVSTRFDLAEIGGSSHSSHENKSKVYFLKNYIPKQDQNHFLIDRTNHYNDAELISYSDIFTVCEQPGNKKDRSGKTSLEGFYRQTKYRMNPDFSFCLFLQTNNKIDLTNGDCFFATMGGDQSLFEVKLNYQNQGEDYFSLNCRSGDPKPNEGYIKFISHAFVSNSILFECKFSIIETASFRYIYTETAKTTDWNNVRTRKSVKSNTEEGDNRRPQMSKQIRLLNKGSILYSDNLSKVMAEIEKHEAYRAIGYNYYEVINQ
ncbi:MAG: hypothetical protein LBV74_10985 [Tannerella sp.]|jgi:CRISPR-associated protein Cmr3|nr:hypothetical protein [Tannerella sp.]